VLTTLTGPGLAVLLLIAGISGAVGTALRGGRRGRLVASVALGLAGAVLGPWLAHEFHVAELVELQVSDQPFPLVSSALGAAVSVALLYVLSGRQLLRS
jgi:uncharacterized membrane protein YeaQ/YmgE (transglycosylase-associated protein family)